MTKTITIFILLISLVITILTYFVLNNGDQYFIKYEQETEQEINISEKQLEIVTPPSSDIPKTSYITNVTTSWEQTSEGKYTLNLRWEVKNGIGCCNTYNCNKVEFFRYCVYPNFKLYNLFLDGKLVDMGNTSNLNYTCSYKIPWNHRLWYNLSGGEHEILIRQKDCYRTIDEKKVILFL